MMRFFFPKRYSRTRRDADASGQTWTRLHLVRFLTALFSTFSFVSLIAFVSLISFVSFVSFVSIVAFSGMGAPATAQTSAKAHNRNNVQAQLISFEKRAAINRMTPEMMPVETLAPEMPAEVKTFQDDRLCTVYWNGWPQPNNGRATSYEVQWGEIDKPYGAVIHTENPVYQAQPLEFNVPYRMRLRAKDGFGKTSEWTNEILFSMDDRRVKAAKALCLATPGGIYDDFNRPQGPLDTPLWNCAVTRYIDETTAMFALNNQFHAHIQARSKPDTIAQAYARLRASLDLSDGKARTIFIDSDLNPNPRGSWYIDLIPESATAQDLTNRQDLETTASSDGGAFLRIRQREHSLTLQAGNAQGGSAVTKNFDLASRGLWAAPNVRIPWKFSVSKKKIEAHFLNLDGRWILAGSMPLDLKENRYRTLIFTQYYNIAKDGFPYGWLWHWDNVGFDAPANSKPNPLTYSYTTRLHNGREYGKTFQIKIPDAVGNWKHRLYYTIQKSTINASNFRPGAANTVTVNGRSFPVTVPDDEQRSVALDLPPHLIRTGAGTINDITFALDTMYDPKQTGALNVHIEAVRNAGSGVIPRRSPHCAIWGCDGKKGLTAFVIGPDVTLDAVGEFPMWRYFQSPDKPVPASGSVVCKVSMGQLASLITNGKAVAAAKLQFLIDGVVVSETTFPADSRPIAGSYRFTLDTTRLTDGIHTLYPRAVTGTGTYSFPRYGMTTPQPGIPKVIRIDVRN